MYEIIISLIAIFAALFEVIRFCRYLIKRHRNKKAKKNFEQQKSIVEQQFQERLARRIKAERIVYETSINALKAQQDELCQNISNLDSDYKKKVEELDNSFIKEKQQLDQYKEELMKKKDEELCSDLQAKQQRFFEAEAEIDKSYNEKLAILDAQYIERMETYNAEYLKYEKKVLEQKKLQEDVVSRLKKDEEVREQQNFYRVKLDQNSISDISKLQSIADQLSNPTAIYKVIWEVYYKAKFNEMIGRVIQDKDSGGIYKITNIVNGKTYIGKTVNFKTRWTTHAKRALRCETFSVNKLYTEMWEQGLYNFSFEIVEVCDKEKQTAQEKFWISFYKSNEFGYNTQT